MARSSFTVSFRKMEAKHRTVVLGVTSIVPNLDGLLLFTEDGKNYQVESHEMLKYGDDTEDTPHLRLRIEYSDEWDFESYLDWKGLDLHDHRKKES